MLTLDDIVSRCPLSERPVYLVFTRQVHPQYADIIEPYWIATALVSKPCEAIFWANYAIDDAGYVPERFVVEMTYAEASNIKHSQKSFSDAEAAIYRHALPVAAE